MAFANTMFSSTRRKIVLSLVLLSSVLLVVSSLVMIVLLRFEITRQARYVLRDALESVQTDYQADRLSSKVGSVFQVDNTRSVSY